MKTKFSRNAFTGFLSITFRPVQKFIPTRLAKGILWVIIAICLGQLFSSTVLGANAQPTTPGLTPTYLANPVKLNSAADCSKENIRHQAFSSRYDNGDKIKLCLLLDRLRSRLWQARGRVAELDYEVNEIWRVAPLLYFEKLGWADKFLSGTFGHAVYQQIFYPDRGMVRRGTITMTLSEDSFPYTFLHELRHVRDLHDQYYGRAAYSTRQLEERGFLLESYYTEATRERVAFFKEFWRDEWRALTRYERRERSLASINGYMRRYYKDLFKTPQATISAGNVARASNSK